MRTLSAAAAALAVLLTVGGLAQAPQEKGGGDETGPYDLVAGWPQNYCGEGFQIGSTAGHLGGEPGPRAHLCPRLSAGPEARGRRRGRRRRARPGAQCLRVRPLAERSGPPSSLGSRRHLCRPQRQDDRVVGAAQQVVRATAPRSWSAPTIPSVTSGSWTMARMRSTSSRAMARSWCRPSVRPCSRATTRHISRDRPTSPGCPMARSSSAMATSTLASSSSTRTASSCITWGEAGKQPNETRPSYMNTVHAIVIDKNQTHLHQRSRELADPGVRREWEVPGCVAEGQAPLFAHADRRSASLGG